MTSWGAGRLCSLLEMTSELSGHGEAIVDLRSDTVTRPTDAMREAMAKAMVGDDVFGDDPTVQRLEQMAAHMLGKEAALFLPSGTMANLVAVMAHTVPGQEVLLGEDSHIYCYEVGGIARVAGLLPRLFRGDDGHPMPDELRALLRPPNVHFPTTALLCLENTHNLAGGIVLSTGRMRGLIDVAREVELPVHLDGARLFHAATALQVDVRALTADVDSVMIALSKALSAPVGSVLAGRREFIDRARKVRKLLGGGMRQVGVVAAAGIVALETMVSRLADDHAVAGAIADQLATIDGIVIERARVQTNIILFSVSSDDEPGDAASFRASGAGSGSRTSTGAATPADGFLARLARNGVLAVAMGPRQVRFVTHRHVSMDDVPRIAAAVRASL